MTGPRAAEDPRREGEGAERGDGTARAAGPRRAGAPAVRAESAPEVIADRYEILGLLGMGGMGSVYRVRDRELDEVVALKFLRKDLVGSPGMLERFRQEVRLARRVTHVNVARTFDIGEHDGERFLTMEYVEGESLAELLVREGPLPSRRAIELGLAIGAALEAAHAAGVVHRDLKPENVLVEAKSGRAVVTDFGIARAHDADGHTGGMLGTAAYMAPEQVEGRADVDGRADLYALGAVLFELLTGARAWTGESFLAVAVRRLNEPPPDPRAANPAVPTGLAECVLRCMARDREARFATAAAVAEALRAITSALPTSDVAPPPSLVAPAARALRVAPVPVEGDKTVAVLPFVTDGDEDAFLAEALADDLVDALSTTRGLRVRPRGMVELYGGEGPVADPRALGRALEVQVIVEGTIRRSGETVRLHARLISVADGFQLWGRRFDRPARELLAINDELASAVAEALTVARVADPRPAAPDSAVIELQLRARQALRQGWGGMADLGPAVALFEQALARAPDDPGLLSGYAMARARRLNYAPPGTDDAASVFAAADRALAAAPSQGEPWLARATALHITSDWAGAVTALRAALTRAPGLLPAHALLGNIQLEIGAAEEGVFRLETALSLDPTLGQARWELARGQALLGRWDRTDVLLSLPVDRPEDNAGRRMGRARTNLWRGARRHDPAGDDHEIVRFSVGAYVDALEAGIVRPERLAELERHMADRMSGARMRPLALQMATEICAATGHPSALEYATRAVDEGLMDLTWLDRCPVLAPLREDPAFAALRARLVERVAPVRAALEAPVA